jgi:hypothetical protein
VIPEGRRGLRMAVSLLVVLAAVLLGCTWLGPVPLPPSHYAPDARASLRLGGGPDLRIAPSSWWMIAGNSTGFSATWAGVPPGCTNVPLWFHWEVAHGGVAGSVAPSVTASANFTSSSAAQGLVRVVVRAAATLTCGSSETSLVRSAVANVTVVAPPELGALSYATDPIGPGNLSRLTGTIENGVPPYRLRVAWGDGATSSFELAVPGPFSFAHRFSQGTFTSDVIAVDADGLSARGAPGEPLYSSSGFAVALKAGTLATEVGVPDVFYEEFLHPPSSYLVLAECGSFLPKRGLEPSPSSSAANFTCEYSSAQSAVISFEATGNGVDIPPASAELTVPVLSALSLVVAPPPPGEVGTPSSVALTISGGVPPFALSWRLVGNASENRVMLFRDGTVYAPVWPSHAGSFEVNVTIEDATGVRVANSTILVSAEASLNASAAATSVPTPEGSLLDVSGSVESGAPPFVWWVLPDRAASNSSPPTGELATVGAFEWSGILAAEGRASVAVSVADADGSVWEVTLDVGLIPELSGSAEFSAQRMNSSSALTLDLTISGGLPPFLIWTNASGETEWNGSVPSDGRYVRTFAVNASGPTLETVGVVDALGAHWYENASVNLSAPSPSPSPSPTPPPPPPPTTAPPAPPPPGSSTPSPAAPPRAEGPTTLLEVTGGTLLAVGLAATAAYYWRRRQRAKRAARTEPDPVLILRQIVEPADGADRSTVELLAEEQGVPITAVRATIDRLVSEGALRSETGPDGEEVLAWANAGAP